MTPPGKLSGRCEPLAELVQLGEAAPSHRMGNTRRLLIAHPMDSYRPDQGGGIRYLMNALHAALGQGWEIGVIGYANRPSSGEAAWAQTALFSKGDRGFFSRLVPWLRYLVLLYLKLPGMRIPGGAVVLAHRMDVMLAFVLFKPHHPKILVSAAPMYYLRLKYPMFLPLLRWGYQRAERICLSGIQLLVPVDRLTADYYHRCHPGLAKRIVIIPSSIDLSHFTATDKKAARQVLSLPAGDPLVIFVGRIAPVKNLPFLLNAFRLIQQRLPNSRLLIVGDGESAAQVVSQASRMKHVTFVGAVPPAAVPLYLSAADVLALCSIEEGSPTVVKEALACGLPVVSTDVGDVRQVLARDPCLGTVSAAQESQFAHHLLYWLRAASSKGVRRKRRQVALQFDSKSVNSQLVSLMEGLVCESAGTAEC